MYIFYVFILERGFVTDINAEYDKDVFKALKKIDKTIKLRVLY